MNYLLIYALAVPYYLFLNVEVTSSWIPWDGCSSYHDGLYSTFYIENDPLDNAVPSLHIAIPFGIILEHPPCPRPRHPNEGLDPPRLPPLCGVQHDRLRVHHPLPGIHWIIDIPWDDHWRHGRAVLSTTCSPACATTTAAGSAWTVRKSCGTSSLRAPWSCSWRPLRAHHAPSRYRRRARFVPSCPGDSIHDIVQPVEQGDDVIVTVTNLDDETPCTWPCALRSHQNRPWNAVT